VKEQEQLALEKQRLIGRLPPRQKPSAWHKQRNNAREQEKAEQDFLALARVEAELRTAETIEAARAANAEKERQAKEAAEAARALRQQEEAQRRAKERSEYERLQREKWKRIAGEEKSSGRKPLSGPGPERLAILLAIPILGLAAWVARSYQVRRAALRNRSCTFRTARRFGHRRITASR